MAITNYFNNLGSLAYVFKDDDKARIITNVLRHASLSNLIKDEGTAYDDYFMKDGDTPDSIAHAVYGDSEYNWLFLMANNIQNVYTDLPLNQHDFEKHLNNSYPGWAVYVDPPDGNFVVGETFNGESIPACVSWNPDYRCLVFLNDVVSVGDTITGDTSGVTTTVRRIQLHTDALKFFTDDGSPTGNVLSPLWIIDLSDFDSDPLKYTRLDVNPSDTDQSIIRAYIHNIGQFGQFAVSNVQYEMFKNDEKRKKRILKPEYIPMVTRQLSQMF